MDDPKRYDIHPCARVPPNVSGREGPAFVRNLRRRRRQASGLVRGGPDRGMIPGSVGTAADGDGGSPRPPGAEDADGDRGGAAASGPDGVGPAARVEGGAEAGGRRVSASPDTSSASEEGGTLRSGSATAAATASASPPPAARFLMTGVAAAWGDGSGPGLPSS